LVSIQFVLTALEGSKTTQSKLATQGVVCWHELKYLSLQTAHQKWLKFCYSVTSYYCRALDPMTGHSLSLFCTYSYELRQLGFTRLHTAKLLPICSHLPNFMASHPNRLEY